MHQARAKKVGIADTKESSAIPLETRSQRSRGLSANDLQYKRSLGKEGVECDVYRHVFSVGIARAHMWEGWWQCTCLCGAGAESSGAWPVVNIDALEVEVTTIEAHCVGGVGGYLAWDRGLALVQRWRPAERNVSRRGARKP